MGDNMERVSAGSQKGQANKQMASQRAKSHLQKVERVAAEQKQKLIDDSTAKNLIISSKLENAELKKQQILDEIKEKAKQSAEMKGTKNALNENLNEEQ